MSDTIKVGDLVCLVPSEVERVGLVLTTPEKFGFLDGCHVLWPGEEVEWCWVDSLKLAREKKRKT